MRRTHNPNPALTFGGMSQMVRAGDTLYLSGQCAQEADGELVGTGEREAQARQCFRNIADLLALEGASLADVVKLNCYAVDHEAYRAYSAVKRELFIDDCPTGTTVLAHLLDPRFLLEVEAVAVIGDGR